jgi:hypothetical protein
VFNVRQRLKTWLSFIREWWADHLDNIEPFATESDEEIKELNNRYMVEGECCCPLCKALEKWGGV